MCVCHFSSTLLGTVLSLQPQRSVAQGESKEEKVSLLVHDAACPSSTLNIVMSVFN